MSSREVSSGSAGSAGMVFHPTPLADVLLVERARHGDSRGSFERLFGAHELETAGIPLVPKQVNRSTTAQRGTLRGMHFQYPPRAEVKLVSCTRGSIFDVVVDLRPESSTYLRHWGVTLVAAEPVSLLVPTGFAHGFVSTEDDVEVIYVASEQHVPEAEDGLRFDDEMLHIHWPIPVRHLSEKDAAWAPLVDRVGAMRARFAEADRDG